MTLVNSRIERRDILVLAITLVSAAMITLTQAAGARQGVTGQTLQQWDQVRKLYHENCVMCHGEDGVPLVPGTPDFSKGEHLNKSDAELLKTIKEGKDVMPPWKDALNESQRHDMLRYVRSIAGDKVFQEKCNKCHGQRVPALPETVPKTEQALRDYKGSLDICREKVEEGMSQKDVVDVVLFLRTLEQGQLPNRTSIPKRDDK